MFHQHAWAVGSYSSGPPAWELSKSKSTQPRSARRCPTLYMTTQKHGITCKSKVSEHLSHPVMYAGLKKWLKSEERKDNRLSVFATTNSRHFPHNRWEPVLIAKGQELPLLDERLLLEGARVSSVATLSHCDSHSGIVTSTKQQFTLHCPPSGRFAGFVNNFLRVPLACLGSREAAQQMWNS